MAKKTKNSTQVGACLIKPLSHRLIVEERSAIKQIGSIALAETTVNINQSQVTEGIVISMAIDAFDYLDESERPKLGDVVHFIKYDGIGKEFGEKKYRILKDDSVWGISDPFLELDKDLL